MSAEYIIPHKHTLKFLCKLKHFPRRYKKNVSVCFFLKTVYNSQCSCKLLAQGSNCFTQITPGSAYLFNTT